MLSNFKNMTFAAALGLSVAAVALPAFADNNDYRRGDCSEGGRGYGRMDPDRMGQGMGKGMHRQEGERAGMSQPQGGRRMMDRFAIIDQNDDGRISDDEAAAQREFVFASMDSDDDGELTEEEFMSVFMGRGESRNSERVEQRQQAKRARFAPMDKDNSGKVSVTEWMAEGQERFASADMDKDGIVTPWEFRSRQR